MRPLTAPWHSRALPLERPDSVLLLSSDQIRQHQREETPPFEVECKETRVDVISCMLLPGLLRAIQKHLWTQTLGEVTVASIAVERYRQEVGQLPPDLDALVPHYLPRVPEDRTGQLLGFRLLPKVYAADARGPGGRDDSSNPKPEKRGFDSDAIVFKFER